MATMVARPRIMRDSELDRPEQIEARIAQIRSACPGGVFDAQSFKRIQALKSRLPRKPGEAVLDANLLISKADVASGYSLRGDFCLSV